jgi:ubiquinone/menaquinone biosynthesis C-methylase UbiE
LLFFPDRCKNYSNKYPFYNGIKRLNQNLLYPNGPQAMKYQEESQIITEAFTELAPEYQWKMDQELEQFWGISYQDFVGLMVEAASIKPGERVLDIATGTAVIPREMQKRSPRLQPIVGLDITPAMLQQARQELNHLAGPVVIHLVCASAMTIPFKAGAFDVLVCGLGTHHMDVPCLLSEAHRVLAATGRLVITDVGASPFWRSWWGRLVLKLLLIRYGLVQGTARAKAESEAFHNVRTAQEWRKLLADSGFQRIEIDQVRPRRPWYPCGLTLKAELIVA